MKSLFTFLLLAFLSTGVVFAQMPVRRGPASDEEIKSARVAVEANMDSINVHRKFIWAMGIDNPLVITQYNTWIQKYPENVNIPLAIGTVYYNAEMAQAKEFLLKAAALQPQNANIWFMLSGDAWNRGQNDFYIEYIKKATLADPLDAGYAYGYLSTFADGDPVDYKQKVFDFIQRFPADERGAQALFWLGVSTNDLNLKIDIFEKLHKIYPPQKFSWSAAGMERLTDIYLQTDPEKALTLTIEMSGDRDWPARKKLAQSFVGIKKLEQSQKYKDAFIELNLLKLPRYNHINDFMLLKKAFLLEKEGDAKAAYDSVAVRFAKLPSRQLYEALEMYGKEIGKDAAQIDKDIETVRNNAAVTAYPFELGLYTSDKKLNLNDLKGKVVLLTFWFPGCGPCREEFPHFEAVIDEFKDKNLVYIGINVYPGQDPYVMQLIENKKYSFIALRGTSAFAAKNYGVQGEPENFLIDKDGKIIFRDFRIDNTNHKTLELMISSLLQKGQ